MTAFVFETVIWMLAVTAVFWALRPGWRMNFAALATGAFLLWWSAATAVLLFGSTFLVWMVVSRCGRMGHWIVPTVAGALVGGGLLWREFILEMSMLHLTGGAYMVLRHVHVLMDVRLRRLEPPRFEELLRYHFFLPVIGAGPIHRFQNHRRECQRHRWDGARFAGGAERVLFGAAKVCVLGDYILARKVGFLLGAPDLVPPVTAGFGQIWVLSAVEWMHLYVTFGGLSDIALGLAAMLGLRLEENFNHPWKARDLLEFWSRWHMTLSIWCRDYVYLPVSAWTRSPMLGLLAAMLGIGLWHDSSAYYVLWSCYHAVGVAGSQMLRRHFRMEVSSEKGVRRGWMAALVTSVLLLAWLAAARPVITLLLGFPR